MHPEKYALQSKLIGCPLKPDRALNLNIEQQESEGYGKKGLEFGERR